MKIHSVFAPEESELIATAVRSGNGKEGGCVLKERSDGEPAAALSLVKSAPDKSLPRVALRLVFDTAAVLQIGGVAHLRLHTLGKGRSGFDVATERCFRL